MSHESRRKFLKTTTLLSGLGLPSYASSSTEIFPVESQNGKLSISSHEKGQPVKPLDSVTINATEAGYFFIRDGRFRMYRRGEGKQNSITFKVGGALGNHFCELRNGNGDRIDSIYFTVNCRTEIQDSKGVYGLLLTQLHGSMLGQKSYYFKVKEAVFQLSTGNLREATHAMLGLKYFNAQVKDIVDLFAENQRADGMVHEYIKHTIENDGCEDVRKNIDLFIRQEVGNHLELRRNIADAGIESALIDCFYQTWKATGDTAWMRKNLDKAMLAIRYLKTDPSKWSQQYQLVKRPFSLDNGVVSVGLLTNASSNDTNLYGVMFGDNLALIAAYRKLAEMLAICARKDDSVYCLQEATALESRLEKLAWNGKFYTSFVPEDAHFFQKNAIARNLIEQQLSQFNAFALLQNIRPTFASAILEQYLVLRKQNNNPTIAEWVTVSPAFDNTVKIRGVDAAYFNGGGSTMVAGALAKGAFENGLEAYGVDILSRLAEVSQNNDGYLPGGFKNNVATVSSLNGNFMPLSIAKAANADFSNKPKIGIPAWDGHSEGSELTDIPYGQHILLGVPFQITDPYENGGKGCIILSDDSLQDYQIASALVIGAATKIIYLLHARSDEEMVGMLTIRYVDGSTYTEYIYGDKIDCWKFPNDKQNFKVAWRSKNKKVASMGLGISQILNPFPNKVVGSLEFYGMKNSKARWMVVGVTLGDTINQLGEIKQDLRAGTCYSGMSVGAGAGMVTHALIEGLVGVKDLSTMFEKIKITPKWEVATEREVTATIKYEASGGYVSYQYSLQNNKITLLYTATGTVAEFEMMLPQNTTPIALRVNNSMKSFTTNSRNDSTYILFSVDALGVNKVEITY